MNEKSIRKGILFLLALMAAILSPAACSSESNGPAEEMHNISIYNVTIYNATVYNATMHNASAMHNGTVSINGTASINGIVEEEFNGTVYRLGEAATAVTVPVNTSRVNLTLMEKVENITLYDEYGKTVKLNSSHRFRQGSYIYSLDFERHIKGKLAYNLSAQGQQFVIPVREKGPVRVILPEGYTTGDRLLGIAWPPPDMSANVGGKKALTWNNTTPLSYIEVNYYRENALAALTIIISILALAGIALLIEYYLSIRKLRALRIKEEE